MSTSRMTRNKIKAVFVLVGVSLALSASAYYVVNAGVDAYLIPERPGRVAPKPKPDREKIIDAANDAIGKPVKDFCDRDLSRTKTPCADTATDILVNAGAIEKPKDQVTEVRAKAMYDNLLANGWTKSGPYSINNPPLTGDLVGCLVFFLEKGTGRVAHVGVITQIKGTTGPEQMIIVDGSGSTGKVETGPVNSDRLTGPYDQIIVVCPPK
jgi:hypothetical protein